MMTIATGGALLIVLASVAPAPVAAQGAQPLHKTDVIRLLASPLISKAEIADLIRRNCLAFRPTERDWADLRALGADADVVSSIEGCRDASTAARAASPLLVVPLLAQVTAQVGGEVVTSVLIKRDGRVQTGAPIALRASSAVPGATLPDVQAVTDESGVAEFHFPAGRRAATYTLTVLHATGVPVAGARSITLVVRPAPPALVTLQPTQVDLTDSPGDAPLSIVATITDSLGNPVPNEVVQLEGDVIAQGPWIASTDSLGLATFTVPEAAVHRAGTVSVLVRGQQLGRLPVSYSDAASATASGFLPATSQSGIVRKRLNEPLVFEVRNAAGRALPGRIVAFQGRNADVVPDSAVTDSAGRAKVSVTLGMHAGLALVTGVVDSISKQIEVHIEPSADVVTTIERDGTRVDGGQLVVPIGTPFVLRVSARDPYGNSVVRAGLTRALEDLRTKLARDPKLLTIVQVDSDTSAATVTFFPGALGHATMAIVDATVSVTVVRSSPTATR